MSDRLFIAIFPPDEVIDALIDEMADIPGVTWQGEEQLHLTLRFLGDVDARQSAMLIAALEAIHFPPLDIMLRGGGAFRRKGRASSVHRLVQPNEPLTRLVRSIDRRCEMIGLGARDRRFLPHVTMARLNASSPDMDHYIARLEGLTGPKFVADRFTLVQSDLSRSGALYTPLVDFMSD